MNPDSWIRTAQESQHLRYSNNQTKSIAYCEDHLKHLHKLSVDSSGNVMTHSDAGRGSEGETNEWSG